METTAKLNRKERTKILVKQLDNLTEEEKSIYFMQEIRSIESGKVYSQRNQKLISLQLSKATICGGFKQWQNQGRKVKKGEHGALILFPVGIDKDANDDDEPTNFFSAVVFDISQTEEVTE
ncbi:MAG: hypothetical protein KDC52_10615 [Ignavibacteriae bacterium]|nr:hypothetical protein [Ignavibacteriota bacterium]MCB0746262.1 hypothetical protein [Ignavibacteriota bacterium]MCB0751917.1 hypothetical protein [Ignavibacteriota bacterium]